MDDVERKLLLVFFLKTYLPPWCNAIFFKTRNEVNESYRYSAAVCNEVKKDMPHWQTLG